jgi:hypothetical protein
MAKSEATAKYTFTYACGHRDSLRLAGERFDAWIKKFADAESKKACVECRHEIRIQERAEERKRQRAQEREERQKLREELNKKEEK